MIGLPTTMADALQTPASGRPGRPSTSSPAPTPPGTTAGSADEAAGGPATAHQGFAAALGHEVTRAHEDHDEDRGSKRSSRTAAPAPAATAPAAAQTTTATATAPAPSSTSADPLASLAATAVPLTTSTAASLGTPL